MKKMKNLLLSTLVLISCAGLKADWKCLGCLKDRPDTEQQQSFVECTYHLFCTTCVANSTSASCPQCAVINPKNKSDVDIARNAAIYSSTRCYNCDNDFNNSNHAAITPEPCHHKICISCAYPLLQNRGYSSRSTHYTNRPSAPQYTQGSNTRVWFGGRYGDRRFEHNHKDVLHDNVVHESSQTHNAIAAQCPVPGCNRAFNRATCNRIRADYNNHAVSFGQYIWQQFGSNRNDRIINSILTGSFIAFCIAVIYKDIQEQKKREITEKPKSKKNQHNQKKQPRAISVRR